MEYKNRADMDPQYTWDLTPIYASKASWEEDMAAASKEIETLSKLPGTLSLSAESLADGLGEIYGVAQRLERLYSYAFLRKAGDNGDPVSQEMEARCIGLLTRFQAMTAFVNPEILAMDEDQLQNYMQDDCLAAYRHMVEDI